MRQVPQPMDALINLLHTVAHSRLVRLQSRAHHSDTSPVAESAVDCCATAVWSVCTTGRIRLMPCTTTDR